MQLKIIKIIIIWMLIIFTATILFASRHDESYLFTDNPLSVKLGSMPNPMDIDHAKLLFGEPDAVGHEAYGVFGSSFFEWYFDNFIYHITNVSQSLYVRGGKRATLSIFADIMLGKDTYASVMRKMFYFYKVEPVKKICSYPNRVQTLIFTISQNDKTNWIVFEFKHSLYKVSIFYIDPENIGYSGLKTKTTYGQYY